MENQNNLVLNDLAIGAIRESAKWTMFLSIIGFIGLALMLLGGIFATVALAAIPDEAAFGPYNPFAAIKNYIGPIYLVIVVIYFFPVLYLYKYSKGAKEALNFNNSELLAEALVNLKSHHKYLGIMTIVCLSMYVVIIIVAIAFAASMASGAM